MFAPREDWATLAQRFAAEGRLRLPEALPEARAKAWHGLLAASENPDLRAVLAAVNASETLAQVRALTSFQDITHADGQATRYRGGHVLTRHAMAFLDKPGAWPMCLA